MKKILYILKHNPWGIGGGCYASSSFLNAFTEVFHEQQIDLFLCEEYLLNATKVDVEKYKVYPVKERSLLSKLFSPLTGELHRHTNAVCNVLSDNPDYDYCVFDHSAISGTLVKHINKLGIKSITIHHNYEPDYYKDNAKNIFLSRIIYPKVIKNERFAYKNSDFNLFLTSEDYSKFNSFYGSCKKNASVIGCFENTPFKRKSILNRKKTEEVKDIKLVISGSLSNVQNIDGILYFFNELLPVIPSYVEVIVAGKNPTQEIINQAASNKNVTLIPNPEDMFSVIEQADVYICPARLGSGIKIRIMDGLRLGLPVISHKISSRGYEVFEKNGFLSSFSTAEEFKIQLNDCIEKVLMNKINQKDILQLYNNNFSFESGVSQLKKIISNNYE